MVRVPTHAPPTHPGEMLLEDFLNPLEITQKEAADALGISYVRLNEIINGRRGITPDTALRLERMFGVEAQFWMNLQLRWDLYAAAHGPEARKIERVKRHPAVAARAGR